MVPNGFPELCAAGCFDRQNALKSMPNGELTLCFIPLTICLCHGFLGSDMPLFEIETDSHIIITWAADEPAAREAVLQYYPTDSVIRLTKRPRDTWVISKGVLGITSRSMDVCGVARDCLAKSAGDKVHAIRLYMHETGSDLEKARRVIESNMVMGW